MVLGVGLGKLCPQDSFGYAFRENKAVRKSTPGGCKVGPRGSKMARGRPPDGSFVQVCPYLDTMAARKSSLGGPKSFQNRPRKPFGLLLGQKVGLEGPSGSTQGPS